MSKEVALDSELQMLSSDKNKKKYVLMRLEEQLFGMSVETIEDILSPQDITPIPLAPPEVMGVLNLRGRIVTAIDLRVRLGIPISNKNNEYRNVVLESRGELYSIIVDEVSDIMNIGNDEIARNPENLSEHWKEVSEGVYSMEKELMIILDITKILGASEEEKILEGE